MSWAPGDDASAGNPGKLLDVISGDAAGAEQKQSMHQPSPLIN